MLNVKGGVLLQDGEIGSLLTKLHELAQKRQNNRTDTLAGCGGYTQELQPETVLARGSATPHVTTCGQALQQPMNGGAREPRSRRNLADT